jgi:hypothetical protein
MTRHRNSIHGAIEDLPTLDVIDAHKLADEIFDTVISALMRDPGARPRCRREWDVALADTRAQVAVKINRRVHNHVDIADVRNALIMYPEIPG